MAEDLNEGSDDRMMRPALAEAMLKDRRRILLACLRDFNEPVTLPDLADEIAVRECGAALTQIPAERVKEIYLSLYHTDIPKLADAGLVQYDQETDLVAAATDLDRIPGIPHDD